MSQITSTNDLLAITVALKVLHVAEPENFVTDSTIPTIALVGTDREFARVSGVIAGHRGSTFLQMTPDGGIIFAMNLSAGQGGYRTEILPEDATTETVLRHAERAVERLRAQVAEYAASGV